MNYQEEECMLAYLLERDGLSHEKLYALSYVSKFELSLKRNLNKFNKEELLKEAMDVATWYDEQYDIFEEITIDYRIKSNNSIRIKYDKFYPDTPVEKTFNDLLGFRSICDNYDSVLKLSSHNEFKVVDMSNGKKKDDGYRGVHIYFQKDHHCYPIEIQYNTYYDRQLNNWLHMYIYKREDSDVIGSKMRVLYEQGKIKTEEDFRKELEKCAM